MNATETEALIDRVRGWSSERRIAAHRALMKQPPLFDIELSAACNIRCAFCPRESMVRRARLMSEATFDAVLAFLPDDAVAMLSGLGEATLHPALPDRVRRLAARGVSTCIITNGVRLTPALQGSLFEAGLAQVQVSVHGLDDEALSGVVVRGARPSRVRSNLEHLSRHSHPGMRVRVNVVETEQNSGAMEEVGAFAERLGFDLFLRRQHTRGGLVGTGRSEQGGCGIFASVTFISVDGEVLPCVNDVGGRHGVGSVWDLSWGSVVEWKRRTVESGEWFSTCSGCNDDYRWVLLEQGGLDEQPKDSPRRAPR